MGMNDSMNFPDEKDILDWDAEPANNDGFGDFSQPPEGEKLRRRSSLVLQTPNKDTSRTATRRSSTGNNARRVNNQDDAFGSNFESNFESSFEANFDSNFNTKGTKELGIEDLFGAQAKQQQMEDDNRTMGTTSTSGSSGSNSRLDYFGSQSGSSSNLTMRPTGSGPGGGGGGRMLQRRGRRIQSRQSSNASLDVNTVGEESCASGDSSNDLQCSGNELPIDSSGKEPTKKDGEKKKKKKKKKDRSSDQKDGEEEEDKKKTSSSRRSSLGECYDSTDEDSLDEEMDDKKLNKKLLYAKMLREQEAQLKFSSGKNTSPDEANVEDAMDRIKLAYLAKRKQERQNSNPKLDAEA